MQAAMVTWDGGSNRQPFEVLCRALVDRGDQVYVLSHNAHRSLYQELGARFDVLPVGEKLPGSRPSADGERDRVVGVWTSGEVADAVSVMLERPRFDAVLVDASLVTALAACDASGVPYVVVHHSLPGAAWSGPRRAQFDALVGPANDARRQRRLDPMRDFGELMSGVRRTSSQPRGSWTAHHRGP